MRKSIIIGRLLLTTCNQGAGAPIIDRCRSRTDDGAVFDGRAIHLAPWRRDRYGTRRQGLALVMGWRRSDPKGAIIPPEQAP